MKRFLKILLGAAVSLALLIGIVCVIVMIRMSRQVDAVTGATFSSAVIKDAVRNALRE